MEYLKNLPEDPVSLQSLVSLTPGQVESRALSRVPSSPMMLMALPEGETLRGEVYPGDTLYYVLSGDLTIRREDIQENLQTGEVLAVPAGVEHELTTQHGAKFLEVTIWNS